MKVGILTFHLGPNHGGYLQAYCLHEYISSFGHEVEFINYKNEGHHQSEIFRPWIYKNPFKLYQAWVKEKVFQEAYKTLPKSSFTTDNSKVSWNDYDVIVVGSDVVWDYSLLRLGRDPVYFGCFDGEFNGKLISYAASAGTVNADLEIPQYVVDGLPNFDNIAVRDTSAQKIVQRAIGVETQLVVDPTWLFLKYFPPVEDKEDIMLVYAYEINKEFKNAIISYAKEKNLQIVAIGYQHSWADKNEMKMSPLQWSDLMRKAKAVVSGTFHGTLYAIRCQTQFITVYNPKIEYRVKRPLELSGLENRMLKTAENFVDVMDEPIDYKVIMSQLMIEVEKSRDYLASIFEV